MRYPYRCKAVEAIVLFQTTLVFQVCREDVGKAVKVIRVEDLKHLSSSQSGSIIL